MRPIPPVVPVPKLWPNSTIVCLGSGPSLTQADVDVCRGHHVIAVNDAYRLAPWADVLYAADARWWRRMGGLSSFPGRRYSIMPDHHQVAQHEFSGIEILRNTGVHGLEMDATALRTGGNSGYQAINLAVHFGATRILLLGYDMHGDHFFGSHPDKTRPPFKLCLESFPTLVEPLADIGVTVINCTPGSALTCFPMAPLGAMLAEVAA